MQRAEIRRYVLVGLVALAAASMFPSFGGGGSSAPRPVSAQRTGYESTDCGTFDSSSIYTTARVIALRGIGCTRALDVARAYDHNGKLLGHWRCALAHGGGTDLFSCGKGGRRGNLRRWPHALLAKGEGTPAGMPSRGG
jgi:hypothetical protein